MVQTYTKDQKNVKLGKHWTVGQLWLNPDMLKLLIDSKLVEALDQFADHFGAKPCFATKNSIYCLGGHSAASFHYKGMAADLYIPGVKPILLAQYAERIGMGGIGVYKDSTRHIHMDTRSTRTCWWVLTSNSKTPGFGGSPTVFMKGHRSPAIKEIQAFLKAEGLLTSAPDGIFGDRTYKALHDWQKAHMPAADGKFGKNTNKAMGDLFDW